MSQQTAQDKPQFDIQHVYVKDISFEAPYTPEIYREKWEPEVNVDLTTNSRLLDENVYDVVLMVTVTVKVKDKDAYIAEAQQAGIFSVKNFSSEQLEHFLAVYCPNILYPYVREVISGLVIRGGFAPLYLAPVNFDALYQQQKNEAN